MTDDYANKIDLDKVEIPKVETLINLHRQAMNTSFKELMMFSSFRLYTLMAGLALEEGVGVGAIARQSGMSRTRRYDIIDKIRKERGEYE